MNYQNPYFNYYQPKQEILRVNGKASINNLQLPPNSSVIAMDTTAPLIWLCMSDGAGTVSATAYDITEHKETPPIDLNSIENRLTEIENKVKEIANDKSASKNTKSKSVNAD